MKRKIFLTIAIILTIGTLVLLGLTFALVHAIVWSGVYAIVLAIPCFVVCLFIMGIALIFFNEAKPKSGFRIAHNITLPLIVVIGLLIDIGVENLSFNIYTSFSPSKWETISTDYKVYMAEDFLSKYDVTNMTMNDVIDLLGEPDEEGDIAVSSQDYPYCYRYYAGRAVGREAGGMLFLLDFYMEDEGKELIISAYDLYRSPYEITL